MWQEIVAQDSSEGDGEVQRGSAARERSRSGDRRTSAFAVCCCRLLSLQFSSIVCLMAQAVMTVQVHRPDGKEVSLVDGGMVYVTRMNHDEMETEVQKKVTVLGR